MWRLHHTLWGQLNLQGNPGSQTWDPVEGTGWPLSSNIFGHSLHIISQGRHLYPKICFLPILLLQDVDDCPSSLLKGRKKFLSFWNYISKVDTPGHLSTTFGCKTKTAVMPLPHPLTQRHCPFQPVAAPMERPFPHCFILLFSEFYQSEHIYPLPHLPSLRPFALC